MAETSNKIYKMSGCIPVIQYLDRIHLSMFIRSFSIFTSCYLVKRTDVQYNGSLTCLLLQCCIHLFKGTGFKRKPYRMYSSPKMSHVYIVSSHTCFGIRGSSLNMLYDILCLMTSKEADVNL